MGLQRLPAIAKALLAAGRAPDEPVALLTDATTPRARREITTLAAAALRSERLPDGATLIVVGPVVELGAILAPWQSAEPAPSSCPTCPQPSSERGDPDVEPSPPRPARERAVPGRAHPGAERGDGRDQPRAAPLARGLSRGLPCRDGPARGRARRSARASAEDPADDPLRHRVRATPRGSRRTRARSRASRASPRSCSTWRTSRPPTSRTPATCW